MTGTKVKTSGRFDSGTRPPVDVSIVIPVRNEAGNIPQLCEELRGLINRDGPSYEVIIINDGSKDDTARRLAEEIRQDPRFTVVEFTRNFGQSAALAAGFALARGGIIVPMDGDLQNDPNDIPALLAQLDEPPGYDIVSGWRRTRQDRWLSRRLPSLIANWFIRKLTWCNMLHDFGCTLKAYRREALEDIQLYGEMHRFLPALCRWRGARVTELPVNHRPRTAGTSKYGLKRVGKILFDLLTVKFLGDYLTKPLYFFGKLALVTFAASSLGVGMAILQKFGYLTEHDHPVNLNDNIFILFAMMTFIAAVMLLMMGVISELLIRIYHESQGRTTYKIRHIHRGCPNADDVVSHGPQAGAQAKSTAEPFRS